MPPNTLAPVSDVWRVAMVAGAGAVPLCTVWVAGSVDTCCLTPGCISLPSSPQACVHARSGACGSNG
jgi:hypothetical protein